MIIVQSHDQFRVTNMMQYPNDITQLAYDGNPNSLIAAMREYANNETQCFAELCGFRINNASYDSNDELYNEGAYEGQGWWKHGTMRGWFVRVQEMPERYVFSGAWCGSNGKLLLSGDISSIYSKIVSDVIEIADANGPNEVGEIDVDSKGDLVLHIWNDDYDDLEKTKIGTASGAIITFPISQSIDSVDNSFNETYNLVVVPYAYTNSLGTHFEDEDAENAFTQKLESRYRLNTMLEQHSPH